MGGLIGMELLLTSFVGSAEKFLVALRWELVMVLLLLFESNGLATRVWLEIVAEVFCCCEGNMFEETLCEDLNLFGALLRPRAGSLLLLAVSRCCLLESIAKGSVFNRLAVLTDT